MQINTDLREIRVKKPFTRVTYEGYFNSLKDSRKGTIPQPLMQERDNRTYWIVTQADFMREYYPTGHRINDPKFYPDVVKIDPVTKKEYVQHVIRIAFAFQRVIATKHLVHLCGNPVVTKMVEDTESETAQKLFTRLKSGWWTHDMEMHWTYFCNSVLVTGDAAMVFFYNRNGQVRAKNFSFMAGDVLYPHYDSDGRLAVFAREYNDFDSDGKSVTTWVEVWDDTNYYRFRRNDNPTKLQLAVRSIFGLSGFELVDSRPHGFSRIPVTYKRSDNGPCWWASQDSIENYELSFCYLCQNNAAYAFPIFFAKGDGVEIVGDDITAAIKAVTLPSDGEAGFLAHDSGIESFNKQLDTLYDRILEDSFIAKTPDVGSGDLPGIAVKLLYARATEKAIEDSKFFQRPLNDMVDLFKEGFGREDGTLTQTTGLKTHSYIEPYIPQNDSELITNLATSVQNGFISVQTAAEKNPYAVPQEMQRIKEEQRQQQETDLLTTINQAKAAQAVNDNTNKNNKNATE